MRVPHLNSLIDVIMDLKERASYREDLKDKAHARGYFSLWTYLRMKNDSIYEVIRYLEEVASTQIEEKNK